MAFTPATGPVIDDPIRPRAGWFWIGGGLIVAAVIGAIVWAVTGVLALDDTVDDFERVPYPGGGTVTIDEPGDYVIYTEGFASDVRAGGVVLTDPGGDQVETDAYVNSLTYDFGGRAGSASATFSAEEAGDYELSSTAADSTNISSLAVGKSIAGDLVSTILGAFLIGGLGGLLGVIVLIVTGIRRGRAKRERRPPAPPPSAWGQAPQTWGPQPSAPQSSPPPGSSPPPPAQRASGWTPPVGSAPPPPGSAGPTPPPPPGWPR